MIGANAPTTSFFVNSLDETALFDTKFAALLRYRKDAALKLHAYKLKNKFFKHYKHELYTNVLNVFQNTLDKFFYNILNNFYTKIINFSLNSFFFDSYGILNKLYFLFKVNLKLNLNLLSKNLLTKFVYLH